MSDMESANGFAVEQIWRYPVKSLGGERVSHSQVVTRGLVGDRLWAVTDQDGKLGSGKNSLRFRRMAGLLGLTSRYPAGDYAGLGPPVITGPDGTDYPVSSGAADSFLRKHIGLPGVRVQQEAGISHFDEVPLSLIGTATLVWLQAQLPEIGIEQRRFRVNLVVRTHEPFVEETWLDREVRIGEGQEAVRAVFDRVLERCVMVGMAQPGLAESGSVLKRIGQRTDRPLCLALGGHITSAGTMHVGDQVAVSAAGSSTIRRITRMA